MEWDSGKQFESYQLPGQFFARCGFLAIVFDPPGQASEKVPGNDHFGDGVRCYLVGETSSKYFVADAIRCVDYAQTRADTDMRNGVAMTGVSGGGLQRRWRGDEVFHIKDTIKLADEVKGFYRAGRCEEKFSLFIDEAGHCYSLRQAREFVQFMNRWLRNESDREIPVWGDPVMHPVEECRCYPRMDVNMRTLTLDRARELGRNRGSGKDGIRQAAMTLADVDRPTAEVPDARTGEPFQV